MNHTLLTTDKAEIMGLELHEDFTFCGIFHEEGYSPVLDLWFTEGYQNVPEKSISLPAGDWQLLGWSNEITEEQAAMVVEKVWIDNENTGQGGWVYMAYSGNDVCFTALESLTSLLASKGIIKRLYLIYKLK